jgi:hypothetical protein
MFQAPDRLVENYRTRLPRTADAGARRWGDDPSNWQVQRRRTET